MEAGDRPQNEENLPPGFRFHPTDEELITYYLVNKISDTSFTARAIGDVDLNKCEPWDLPGKAKMGEKEWYFFNLRDRKYPTGVRTNRATSTGYWKTTGKDREIFNSVTTELVGMKKTLVFYKGRAPRGEKSNWVMHEYRVHSKSAYKCAKDAWVVCRVFQKTAGVKKYPTTTQSSSSRSIINLDIIGSNNHFLPSPIINMMPLDHPPLFPIGIRSSYMMNNVDQLAELSRALRTTGSTTSNFHLGGGSGGVSGGGGGGGFTISGLNLNLGGGGPGRPMMNQQQGGHDVLSSAMVNGLENNNGYGSLDININNMESCVEFDNYWPTY